MARQNRRDVFDPMEVSVVHCIQRAVRRVMLCGLDPYSGKSFEHRREWIRQRLIFLASQYGIDVLGYAIMGNHVHFVLRNRPDVVETWSDEEVAQRIWNLFPKRKDAKGQAAEPREHELNSLMGSKRMLREYRRRLSDVSWLMRQFAEKIARMANHEDQCTGRFWEGRFRCIPLLDEAAILGCAAYVDLNPVRAGIAKTPEESDYTSIQDRIESAKAPKRTKPKARSGKLRRHGKPESVEFPDRDGWLAPINIQERGSPGPKVSKSGRRASNKGFLPMSLTSYLQLVDWTGRQLAGDKKARIPASSAPILQRLGLERDTWCTLVKDFGRLFRRVAGSRQSLSDSARSSGLHYRQSSGGAALLSAVT
jgi:REP element-mobilizing transposase RayT